MADPRLTTRSSPGGPRPRGPAAAGGMFSVMPQTAWPGRAVANNGADELRAIFRVLSARLEIAADRPCTLEVYLCMRAVDLDGWPPSWRECLPAWGIAWSAPGGLGALDAMYVAEVRLAAAGRAGRVRLPLPAADLPVHVIVRRKDVCPGTAAVFVTAGQPPGRGRESMTAGPAGLKGRNSP